MRTHVFIVNEETFPIHLQYMFAGTGAKDKNDDLSLLADISRVRVGDLVIFYIEGTTKVKGGFYGIFQITDTHPTVLHAPEKMVFSPAFLKSLFIEHYLSPMKFILKGYQSGRHWINYPCMQQRYNGV